MSQRLEGTAGFGKAKHRTEANQVVSPSEGGFDMLDTADQSFHAVHRTIRFHKLHRKLAEKGFRGCIRNFDCYGVLSNRLFDLQLTTRDLLLALNARDRLVSQKIIFQQSPTARLGPLG